MKKIAFGFLLALLCQPSQVLQAQEKTAEKQEGAKSEEKRKPLVMVRVQLVFSEYEGDKKIASLPYSFTSVADERTSGPYPVHLRTGVRVPIETDGKDQKTIYLDIGSNIDCGLQIEDDGRYRIYLVFERSALYANSSMGEEKLDVPRPNGQPLIRQLKIQQDFLVRDGQSLEDAVSTDPLNGHIMRVSITVNVIK